MSHPLREIAFLFLRLGFTAFGGPAAHIVLIEEEVVHRRKWLDRRHFMDLVSSLNFIPGPNSTELAIYSGYARAGLPGLVTAGVCFITPAVLIILPLAYIYVTYGDAPRGQSLMAGINAAVIAVIAAAVWRFARGTLTTPFPILIAILAAAAALIAPYFARYQPDLIILAAAGLIGALRQHPPAVTPLLLPLSATDTDLLANLGKMFLFFLKVGGTLFGSGYVLISYLQVGLVDQLHWLTQRRVLDAVAVGQMTPGPLLTTATFIGFLLAHDFSNGSIPWSVAGAILATIGMFLPSFLFVAIFARVLQRIRTYPAARGALDAMNAAVVALIAVAGYRLASTAVHDLMTSLVFAISLAIVAFTKLNATWVVAFGALVGLVTSVAA